MRVRNKSEAWSRAVLFGLFGMLVVGAGCRGAGPESAVAATLSPVAACVPSAGTDLVLRPIAEGLRKPVLLITPPGEERLFVLEQPGRVRILGSDPPATFLDIRRQVEVGFSEQGLLGLAFHPDYAANGRYYVNYTEIGTGSTVIAEYQASADRSRSKGDETRLLTIRQPFVNHNGGHIAFGPDGLLYLGMGDGGAGGDPKRHGQNGGTELGSLLRINVDEPGKGPEVVAIGLRNPWRFSFDRENGDLWLGDVGQGSYEEVNRIPNGAVGLNFGWNTMEGAHCYGAEECVREGMTLPVIDVPRSGRCDSITGGYVYRGRCLPDLVGTYFYGDYCDNWVRSLRLSSDGAVTERRDWTHALEAEVDGLSSFSEDASGELYVLSHRDGVVYKLVSR